jgi:RNA polymerase sigma-70 factor (ECF subfamily)
MALAAQVLACGVPVAGGLVLHPIANSRLSMHFSRSLRLLIVQIALSQHKRGTMANPTTSAPSATTARAELVTALVATGEQDRLAFRQVYQLTSAKLFGICVRICGDRQAAEDVLHEVYLTVWKRAGGYEPGRASPITWLATIARNRAIDWRRSTASHASLPLGEAPDMADDAPSAVDVLLARQADRALHLCLDDLEGNQRDAIRGAFFGGATYAELALSRNVALGTMKSWVRRGLLRLRECLGGQ